MRQLPETRGERVVAVLPAAGQATRLADIAGSKEVLHVAGRPAIVHLLNRLSCSGVHRALVVLRQGKWDIPSAVGTVDDVEVSYVIVDSTPSELHSVARGVRLADDAVVALAYPDVLFQPRNAFASLLERQRRTGADLVLGLFPCDSPERVDMVVLDQQSKPVEVVVKQPDRGLSYSWSIAVWAPSFSRYLMDFVSDIDDVSTAGGRHVYREPSVGHVIQTALVDGFTADAVTFEAGRYFDIGTPEGLEKARRVDRW